MAIRVSEFPVQGRSGIGKMTRCSAVTALFLRPGSVVATTSTPCSRFMYDLSGLDGAAVNRL
ncbi:hypothetical protein MNBD_ACTINO02-508 [hydrothermal vent metagenome]|uniref:Uncharacterized protein n=1 Tax=hydrothermal vent metagenome TaxID=652676 RepID=A0A3B0S0N3_9ZZZZ